MFSNEKMWGGIHPRWRPRIVLAAVVALLALPLSKVARDMTGPSHYRDPCTGQMIPRRMSSSDFWDQQALARAKNAYEGGYGDRPPTFACDQPPADPAKRAQMNAGLREIQMRAENPPAILSEDQRAYDHLRARGHSDREAREMAGSVRSLCEAAGGEDCR